MAFHSLFSFLVVLCILFVTPLSAREFFPPQNNSVTPRSVTFTSKCGNDIDGINDPNTVRKDLERWLDADALYIDGKLANKADFTCLKKDNFSSNLAFLIADFQKILPAADTETIETLAEKCHQGGISNVTALTLLKNYSENPNYRPVVLTSPLHTLFLQSNDDSVVLYEINLYTLNYMAPNNEDILHDGNNVTLTVSRSDLKTATEKQMNIETSAGSLIIDGLVNNKEKLIDKNKSIVNAIANILENDSKLTPANIVGQLREKGHIQCLEDKRVTFFLDMLEHGVCTHDMNEPFFDNPNEPDYVFVDRFPNRCDDPKTYSGECTSGGGLVVESITNIGKVLFGRPWQFWW